MILAKVLPSSKIYVYDNSSTDSTSTIAKRHGAIVYKEPFKGYSLHQINIKIYHIIFVT